MTMSELTICQGLLANQRFPQVFFRCTCRLYTLRGRNPLVDRRYDITRICSKWYYSAFVTELTLVTDDLAQHIATLKRCCLYFSLSSSY